MSSRIHYIAGALLALALMAWGVLFYESSAISAAAADSASNTQSAQQQVDRVAYQKRLAALALDTQDARARLQTLVNPDVITIVNTLEAAGKSAGTSVQVNDAQPEGSNPLPTGSLQTLSFVLEARDRYSTLMRLTALLETLPLVSEVKEVEIEHVGTTPADWHLTARVRVYTTALISS